MNIYNIYKISTPLLWFQNGPVKKERFSSSSSSSFTSSFSFSSRPFNFNPPTASSGTLSSSSGGLLSVGRRLAMAMELHSRPAGSASSPPPPPPSSPAPPLPPRVRGQLRFWNKKIKADKVRFVVLRRLTASHAVLQFPTFLRHRPLLVGREPRNTRRTGRFSSRTQDTKSPLLSSPLPSPSDT